MYDHIYPEEHKFNYMERIMANGGNPSIHDAAKKIKKRKDKVKDQLSQLEGDVWDYRGGKMDPVRITPKR